MSRRYGSLRAITAIYSVIISGLLLMGSFSVAKAASTSGSVIVSATIQPVRIIIVNDQGIITQILSNGPSNAEPFVQRGNTDGEQIDLTKSINEQYLSIMRGVDSNKTGVIYKLKDSKLEKSSKFLQPIIIPVIFGAISPVL